MLSLVRRVLLLHHAAIILIECLVILIRSKLLLLGLKIVSFLTDHLVASLLLGVLSAAADSVVLILLVWKILVTTAHVLSVVVSFSIDEHISVARIPWIYRCWVHLIVPLRNAAH